MARSNRKAVRRITTLINDANRAARNRDHRSAATLSERAEELCYKLGLTGLLKGLKR